MNLTEDLTERTLISSYTAESICIGETTYHSSILILPSGEVLTWPVQQLEDIQEEHCQTIIQHQPEMIIIGTGQKHQLPNLDLIRHFANHKMGIEVMSTPAACRTYNVLALENRHVAAGLIL